MKVLKFGGTSVGSAARMKSVANLVSAHQPCIVVLSAMSGTTNSLVEISEYFKRSNADGAAEVIASMERKYCQVSDELLAGQSARESAKKYCAEVFSKLRDYANKPLTQKDTNEILAQGELLSTMLFSLYAQEAGLSSALLPALSFMSIDADGEPEMPSIRAKLKEALAGIAPQNKLIITQGFICLNQLGEIDNLKRGGSDYSASLIGAAISSPEIQIWTDIDGVHNNDPRFVEGTSPIAKLTFDEAAELAYFGAKVLHPLSVLPAKMGNIPVLLKNTMEPEAEGTTISNKGTGSGIKAVAAKDGITAIKIKSSRMLLAYGFLRKIFEVFEKYRTSIDMVTTSEVALSLTIDNTAHLQQILEELKGFGSVSVDYNQTIICVVGNMIAEEKGHAVDILNALGDISVRMISYGGSLHNISMLIDTANKEKALRQLHAGLFL
jgi:aspartate kinase